MSQISLVVVSYERVTRLTCSIADNGHQNETNELLGDVSVFDDIVDTTNHEFGGKGDENCCNG